MIIYTLAKTKNELMEILSLQEKNFKDHLSEQEMLDEGFLSLKHELPELEEISGNYHHIIAKENDKVIGYALVMLKQFKDKVPVLIPMFDQIDALQLNGKFIKETDYFVMGQICIDKDYRGMGVFKGLYQKLKEAMSSHFEITVTEVATRNLRSMKAHRGVGFKSMLDYVSPESEEWALIFWDWK
jgi:predicted GNAT family N-acyltransferase